MPTSFLLAADSVVFYGCFAHTRPGVLRRHVSACPSRPLLTQPIGVAIMRLLNLFAICSSLVLVAASSRADDKKEESKSDDVPRLVVDQIEKEWGLKLKSNSKKEGKSKAETELKLTFEFVKEVPDVAEMRKVFVAMPGPPRQIATHPLVFHLFDKDNVSLGKYTIRKIEGDLTGVKGDSFRIVIVLDTASLSQATKLEARLKDAPKK
jgi:hypothetical protein